MTAICIELVGGPLCGRRNDHFTPGVDQLPHITRHGWTHWYQPAGRRTTEGRHVYQQTAVLPATPHPSTMQGGDQ